MPLTKQDIRIIRTNNWPASWDGRYLNSMLDPNMSEQQFYAYINSPIINANTYIPNISEYNDKIARWSRLKPHQQELIRTRYNLAKFHDYALSIVQQSPESDEAINAEDIYSSMVTLQKNLREISKENHLTQKYNYLIASLNGNEEEAISKYENLKNQRMQQINNIKQFEESKKQLGFFGKIWVNIKKDFATWKLIRVDNAIANDPCNKIEKANAKLQNIFQLKENLPQLNFEVENKMKENFPEFADDPKNFSFSSVTMIKIAEQEQPLKEFRANELYKVNNKIGISEVKLKRSLNYCKEKYSAATYNFLISDNNNEDKKEFVKGYENRLSLIQDEMEPFAAHDKIVVLGETIETMKQNYLTMMDNHHAGCDEYVMQIGTKQQELEELKKNETILSEQELIFYNVIKNKRDILLQNCAPIVEVIELQNEIAELTSKSEIIAEMSLEEIRQQIRVVEAQQVPLPEEAPQNEPEQMVELPTNEEQSHSNDDVAVIPVVNLTDDEIMQQDDTEIEFTAPISLNTQDENEAQLLDINTIEEQSETSQTESFIETTDIALENEQHSHSDDNIGVIPTDLVDDKTMQQVDVEITFDTQDESEVSSIISNPESQPLDINTIEEQSKTTNFVLEDEQQSHSDGNAVIIPVDLNDEKIIQQDDTEIAFDESHILNTQDENEVSSIISSSESQPLDINTIEEQFQEDFLNVFENMEVERRYPKTINLFDENYSSSDEEDFSHTDIFNPGWNIPEPDESPDLDVDANEEHEQEEPLKMFENMNVERTATNFFDEDYYSSEDEDFSHSDIFNPGWKYMLEPDEFNAISEKSNSDLNEENVQGIK